MQTIKLIVILYQRELNIREATKALVHEPSKSALSQKCIFSLYVLRGSI